MPRATDHVGSDALRFLVAGGLNTALTTLVYFAGLLLASPGVPTRLPGWSGWPS